MQFTFSPHADAWPRTLSRALKPTIAGLFLTLAAPVVLAQTDPCLDLIKNVQGVVSSDCRAAALKPTGARSVNGLPLLQREVHANEQAASSVKTIAAVPSTFTATLPPVKVLVLGGIHGDEMSSVALVFRWIALAQAQPAGIHWRFVPALNPDGLLQNKPTRVNANKVDLNRNFPTPGWQHEAAEHWVQRTRKDPRRWPGNTAQSEPETRFVVQTMSQWKPDLIVSIHAPYAVLDFDGPVEPPHRLGKLILDRVGIFPGSLGNYGGMHRNVPVVTLELPQANRLPPDAEVRQMWADLLKWTDQRLVMARAEPPKAAAVVSPAVVNPPSVTPTPAPATTAPEQPVPVPVPAAVPASPPEPEADGTVKPTTQTQ
jgi:murein peptide amidase A